MNGELEVPKHSKSLDKIISSCPNISFEIKNIISKDSLDITNEDRQFITDTVKQTQNENIIIIHGTDTIDKTSKFIKKNISNKKIVFTGAMVPMSIDKVEASMNFSLALGFLNADVKFGTYIAMHGVVVDCSRLVKNRNLGQFLIEK